jgi:hypothetical protein
VIFISCVLTAANAVKPPHIDDTAYIAYARQLTHSPLDPYGFAIFWWNHPQEANTLLAPPVFSYSLALAMRLSDNPAIWKLILFPWALLLVSQVSLLLRRFAARVERPFLVLLILSPAVLPSLNLMLDLPAMAMGLAALNVYFIATERQSLALAAVGGLLAGLAMQTKYTAFLVPGVMFLWSATTQRWRCWPITTVAAVGLFVAWECFVAMKYGASHFMLARQNDRGLLTKVSQLPFLFSQLGGLTVFGVGIGMAALGLRRSLVWCAVALMLLSYVALVALDVTFTSPVHRDPEVHFQLVEVLFNGIALVGTVVVALTAWTLRRIERGDRRRETMFLLLWLGLEFAGFLLLSPFPAVRRVLGVGLVLALLVARLAARRALYLWKRGLLPGMVVGSVILGFAVAARDWAEARVQLQGAEVAADWIAEQGGRGRVWYVGHWGFQFDAERRGMRPVVPHYDSPPDPDGPIRFPPATVFEPGDWIVVPSEYTVIQQSLFLDPACVEERYQWNFGGSLPVRTVRCFYDGRTPLEHKEGPWLTVRAYRVRHRFEATTNP